MNSLCLPVIVLVVAVAHYGESMIDVPCCNRWVKTGWTELSKASTPRPEAICVNGTTRMKFVRGQKLKIRFKPKSRYSKVGLSACRDKSQNDCYVAEIFGLESGRLGYWWRKHTPDEKGGKGWVPGRAEKLEGTNLQQECRIVFPDASTGTESGLLGYGWRRHTPDEKGGKGWVPGRAEKLEETKLQQESRVSQGTWDQEDQTTYTFYVERTPRGRLEIRLDGGDPEQQDEMAFPLPDEYSHIAVASYFWDGTAEVVGAGGCGTPVRIRMRPDQDMRIKWIPGDKVNAVGVSFCSDTGQSECYVLDMFGESNRQLHFWWRRHSSKEKGARGWVPGKDGRYPENVLKGGPSTALNWPDDRMRLSILLKRAQDGKLTVRVDGGDPNQNDNLVFDLPQKYQYGAVDSLHKKPGSSVGVLGPCYNGELFGYLGTTCDNAVNLNRILQSSTGARREVWSPKPGRSKAEMQSQTIELPAGSERLCVSVSGIASENARIVVNAVPEGGDIADGVRVGELVDNGLNPPEWQIVRLVADLPVELRTASLTLIITAERQAGSLVLLQSAELCIPHDCGVATARGRPFIAHGENATLAEFPWHAGIWSVKENKQICGGTLVRPDIVISAAHCFHDFSDKLVDKSEFKIAVGKIFNDLNREEDFQQISDVLAVHIPERYRGSKRLYEHDLAVVQVQFTFTAVVLPLCLDWTGRSLPPLHPGDVGMVAGWRLTQNKVASQNLLFRRLPYIPYAECAKVVPPSFVSYITFDKFCAGNVNGTTVKPGDSGGGLAFQSAGRWYLRGVVSTGVPNKFTYTTFVDLNFFIDWIKGLVPATLSSRSSVVPV